MAENDLIDDNDNSWSDIQTSVTGVNNIMFKYMQVLKGVPAPGLNKPTAKNLRGGTGRKNVKPALVRKMKLSQTLPRMTFLWRYFKKSKDYEVM